MGGGGGGRSRCHRHVRVYKNFNFEPIIWKFSLPIGPENAIKLLLKNANDNKEERARDS